MNVEEPYDYTQEDHMREVERAMMYIAQAQRKAEEIADALEKDGAEERLTDALRTAASALGAEHNRLLNRSHFPVPDLPKQADASDSTQASLEDGPQADPASQQRMAI